MKQAKKITSPGLKGTNENFNTCVPNGGKKKNNKPDILVDVLDLIENIIP